MTLSQKYDVKLLEKIKELRRRYKVDSDDDGQIYFDDWELPY